MRAYTYIRGPKSVFLAFHGVRPYGSSPIIDEIAVSRSQVVPICPLNNGSLANDLLATLDGYKAREGRGEPEGPRVMDGGCNE